MRIYLPEKVIISLLRVNKFSCLPKLKSITVLLYDIATKNETFLLSLLLFLQPKDFLTSFINCY